MPMIDLDLAEQDVRNTSFDYRGYPKFFRAAYAGKHEELLQMFANDLALAKYTDAPIHSQAKQTVLHLACMGSSNVATVEVLLQHGANPATLDELNRTVLHVAANSANPEIIACILKQDGVSERMSGVDSEGRTIFHAICMPGSSPAEKKRDAELEQSLRLLLAAYEDAEKMLVLNKPDVHMVTPLMYAKHFGYIEVLNVAKELGLTDENLANIPEIAKDSAALRFDYWGRVTVQEAAFGSNEELLDKLLADPLKSDDLSVANQQFGNLSLIHYAVLNGRAAVVNKVINAANVPLQSVDAFGRTAMHFAAMRGNYDVLAVLLAKPEFVDLINTPDHFGITPLEVMAMTIIPEQRTLSRNRCFELLLEKGANLAIRNKHEKTITEIATEYNNQSFAAYLARRQEPTISDVTSTSRVDERQLQQEPSQSQNAPQGYFWSFKSAIADAVQSFKACVGLEQQSTQNDSQARVRSKCL